MDQVTHLGLDVHKDTIAVAILRPDQNAPDERVIANTSEALRKLVARRRGSVVACYEAGPTGYETHRLLSSLGVPCDVIAPTLIPRRAGRRVKTDRLDARNLARLHRGRADRGPRAHSRRGGASRPHPGPRGPEGRSPEDDASGEELPTPTGASLPRQGQWLDRQV
jgi:Transposase